MMNIQLIKKSCVGIALMALSLSSIMVVSAQVVHPEPKPALSVPPAAIAPQVKTDQANALKLPIKPSVAPPAEAESESCDAATGTGC